jgi:cold shock CspA family protein
MRGVIWHVYRNQKKGMIVAMDGEQVSFRKSALHGVDFHSLFSGQRVSYRIQEGWLGKEAVEVRPLQVEKIAGAS